MIDAFETGVSLAAPSVVASATAKRPRMARNPAGTPSMERTGHRDFLRAKSRKHWSASISRSR